MTLNPRSAVALKLYSRSHPQIFIMPRPNQKRKQSTQESSKKTPAMRSGPQIASQGNAHLIDQTIAEASRLTVDQREELVDAGTGGESSKKKGRPSFAIDKIPQKTIGGSDIHHCGRKIHKNQKGCVDGGCIIACPKCGAWISAWGNSKCRTCEADRLAERARERARIEEEEEEAARAAEAAEKEAESKKGRKPKWTADKKEEKQRVLQAGHEADLNKARAGAHKAVVIGSRVSKRRGRAGHMARIKEHGREGDGAHDGKPEVRKRRPRLTLEQDNELTIQAAVVLWEYCQELIRAAYPDAANQE